MKKREIIKNDKKKFILELSTMEAAKVSIECDIANLLTLNELNKVLRS